MEMRCPTCATPFTILGCRVSDKPLHYCVVCGTMRTCDGIMFTPLLVERCRKFECGLIEAEVSVDCLRDNWREAGIRDAINTPGDRPQ